MMWLLSMLMALSVDQVANLLSAALCAALALGLNERVAAVLSGLLCLMLMVL
jgi:hypothetical protein